MHLTQKFLETAGTLFDVRSPCEYNQGFIPGALNLPLFSDEERKEVGTVYKQESKAEALKLGLKFVGPKLADFVRDAENLSPNKKVKLYCFRGGMRSHSMAWLLGLANLKSETLEGGYKAFRRYVAYILSQKYPFLILSGMTGSGKTAILKELAQLGEQVIDLEEYANHRGSAFGMLGMPPQPTVEHFENLIAFRLATLDPKRPIWMEDESRLIGLCKIPDPLYSQLCKAPQIRIEKPWEERISCLVDSYGSFSQDALIFALKKIEKRLGKQRTEEAAAFIRQSSLKKAVELVLNYYDKAYEFASKERGVRITTIFQENKSAAKWAELLKEYIWKEQNFLKMLSS